MRSRVVAVLVPVLTLAACGSASTTGAAPGSGPTGSGSATKATDRGSVAGDGTTSSTALPTPSSVSPTGPPATIQVRLVALDNQTMPCRGSDWCANLGYTAALQHVYDTTACHAGDAHADPDPHRPVVACSSLGEKYLLGPAELTNRDVARAAAAYSDTETWAVDVDFTPAGARAFRELTARLVTNDRQYAVIVDGSVVAAPTVFQPSSSAQLTGGESGFTQTGAEELAARINEGAGAG